MTLSGHCEEGEEVGGGRRERRRRGSERKILVT